jgi:hypothetical protein
MVSLHGNHPSLASTGFSVKGGIPSLDSFIAEGWKVNEEQ